MTLKKLVFACLVLLMTSCDSEKSKTGKTTSSTEAEEINIRLNRDPQYVNPFFSPSSFGREVYQYIYLSLADYHPESLKLFPILITEVPEGTITDYKNEKVIAYQINIRPEAEWSDGTPVTAKDYLYTVNAINHTQSKITAWKPYFQFLKGIELDASNPKSLTVYFDKDYMLSKEIALTIQLMPAHIFDPSGAIQSKELDTIRAKTYESEDSTEIKALALLNDSPSKKVGVVQTGPYTLSSEESNQYFILDKKPKYWGNKISNNPFLKSQIKKIIFRIIPDEVAALTMAKDEKLDLINVKSGSKFLELKEDSLFSKNWTFHIPQLYVYYYMAMNNKSEILSDKKVRRAMAHLADIDDYIETGESGFATRTSGPFHPLKPYYNDKLELLPFDVEKAKLLLDESGYTDTDGDGIREKMISGKRVKLELDILMITGSSISKNMSLLYQEIAKQAGVKINIAAKRMSLMRTENLYDYNYDLALLRVGMDEANNDPYRRWHSDNIKPGGSNVLGYSNEKVDKKIELLRVTKDDDERESLYKEIHALIYEDSPCIFLYCPLNKILINNKFKAVTTTKRPGYLANTFSRAE